MAEKVVNNQVGEVVAHLRKEAGLSQAALAQAAGISQTTIDKIERGETRRSKFLPEIAKALHVPLRMLVENGDAVSDMDFGENTSQATYSAVKFIKSHPEYLPLFPTFDLFEKFKGKDDPVSQMCPFIVGKSPIQMTERPSMLMLDDKAYSIYVPDDSMYPEFSAGDILIVSPSHPMVANTSCVLYGQFATIECAMIVRSVSTQDGKWTVRKWNLDLSKSIARENWTACHRIVARIIR